MTNIKTRIVKNINATNAKKTSLKPSSNLTKSDGFISRARLPKLLLLLISVLFKPNIHTFSRIFRMYFELEPVVRTPDRERERANFEFGLTLIEKNMVPCNSL